ncbi:MAG: ferritin family protein [bacterium]
MKDFGSAEEVLNFAIAREEEAAAFYRSLAARMEWPWMTKTFEQFAREEDGHKAKILGIKEGRLSVPTKEKISDLKIGDYLVDVEPTGELDYQEALIVAMKREKASFKLYMNLADAVDNAALRDLFLVLAQEEAKHKLRFELEYDEHILKEN